MPPDSNRPPGNGRPLVAISPTARRDSTYSDVLGESILIPSIFGGRSGAAEISWIDPMATSFL